MLVAERVGEFVRLEGRLDVTTAGEIRMALHDAIDAGDGDLILDMAGVDVIDATGLGVLVGTHRRAGKHGRRLVLRAVPQRVMRVLAVTRLHRVLAVEYEAQPVSA